MSAQEQATPTELRWIGIGVAAGGLYFLLVGLAILPVPGGGPTCTARCGLRR